MRGGRLPARELTPSSLLFRLQSTCSNNIQPRPRMLLKGSSNAAAANVGARGTQPAAHPHHAPLSVSVRAPGVARAHAQQPAAAAPAPAAPIAPAARRGGRSSRRAGVVARVAQEEQQQQATQQQQAGPEGFDIQVGFGGTAGEAAAAVGLWLWQSSISPPQGSVWVAQLCVPGRLQGACSSTYMPARVARSSRGEGVATHAHAMPTQILACTSAHTRSHAPAAPV